MSHVLAGDEASFDTVIRSWDRKICDFAIIRKQDQRGWFSTGKLHVCCTQIAWHEGSPNDHIQLLQVPATRYSVNSWQNRNRPRCAGIWTSASSLNQTHTWPPSSVDHSARNNLASVKLSDIMGSSIQHSSNAWMRVTTMSSSTEYPLWYNCHKWKMPVALIVMTCLLSGRSGGRTPSHVAKWPLPRVERHFFLRYAMPHY